MFEEKKYKDIELRSEKVRNIVGKIPPRLLRIGVSIISVTLVLVLVLAYTIPYPEYRIISIKLYSTPAVETIKAPLSGIYYSDLSQERVKKRQCICSMKFEKDSIINYHSEFNGIVLCNYKNEDYVEQGNILFSVIPDSLTSVYGIGLVPVTEMKNIKRGQSIVLVSSEELSFKGYISKLYPINEIDQSNEKLLTKIEVQLIENIKNINVNLLLPNNNLSCKILISNKPILKRILED